MRSHFALPSSLARRAAGFAKGAEIAKLDAFMSGPDAITRMCNARVGRMLSKKWRLDALVGIGGMAAVYAATHRNGAPCAIKMLHPEVSGIAEVRERFLREAYIGNKVGHPNVIQVQDDDVDEDGCAFMVMELLVGRSLEDVADDNGGSLPFDETLQTCVTVLDALAAAHKVGVIHRDIKPDNVFICKDGTVKVLDFGIARLREAGRDHTATGMLMGTPAYMSPEQALGRQSDIGPHSDVFSVGAMMFKLLSGLRVHEGESDGEVLVAAATRPPRSLATVLPSAPTGLVRIVDKMLAYDIGQRYANAEQVIADIRELLKELQQRAAGAAPAAPTPSADGFDGSGRAVSMDDLTVDDISFDPNFVRVDSELHQRAMTKIDGLEVVNMSDEDIAAAREVCVHLERLLTSAKQYGEFHPEYVRKTEQLFDVLQDALINSDVGLLWNLSPYSFHVGEETVWAPDEPFSEIPYRAFASGLQVLGILPGCPREEFEKFIELLTLDPRNISPENDLVTLIWENEFEHILNLEVDSFSEGDQADREQFEHQKNAVIERAEQVDFSDLQNAWASMRTAGGTGAGAQGGTALMKQTDLLSSLAGQRLKAEAVARVSNLIIADKPNPEAERLVSSMRVDPITRQVLSAQFEQKTQTTSQRFIYAAAEGFLVAKRLGDADSVAKPLQYTVDNLAELTPFAAAHFVISLCQGMGRVSKDPSAPRELCSIVLTHETVANLVETAAKRGEDDLEILNPKLTKLFSFCDHRIIPPMLERMEKFGEDDRVVAPVAEFIAAHGAEHVDKISAMFPTASETVGVALVRILVNIPEDKGRQAVAEATKSPHTLVRVEALGHLEGVAGSRVREEMRKLIEDPDPTVRVSALRAMVDNKLLLAGPFLVMRIKSKEFPKLDLEERREALRTVGALAPDRAEKLCVEIIEDGKLLSNDSHESTREIACEVLGEMATHKSTLEALKAIAGRRWKNSARVREAASRAAGALEARWMREAGDRKVPPPGKVSTDMPQAPSPSLRSKS